MGIITEPFCYRQVLLQVDDRRERATSLVAEPAQALLVPTLTLVRDTDGPAEG